MMLRQSEWHMDRSNWTRYGYLTDIDSKWRYWLEMAILSSNGIFFFFSKVTFSRSYVSGISWIAWCFILCGSGSGRRRRMDFSDWFLSLMDVPCFARDKNHIYYKWGPSRMCQRYHVQHVFRSFLILIMSNPDPYLIIYRRYIWFKSDISVDNSLKSRVIWSIYVQIEPFMSKMVDSQACPHMAILSENRHISSFIGHVPHANSPFSFQGRVGWLGSSSSRVIRFVF